MKQMFIKSLSIILAAVMLICSAPIAGLAGLELADSVSEFFADFAPKASAATSGTCGDNVYWNLDEETGTLTISGTGEMDDMPNYRDNMFSDDPITPWAKDDIKRVIIEEGVTRIGEYAFSDHYYLYDVQIADSVVSIGEGVFQYCDSLKSIMLPKNLTCIPQNMFVLANLRHIYIPASVTTIDYGAFNHNNQLIEIEYTGTEEQWNKITIKELNDELSTAYMVFKNENTLSSEQSGTCGEGVTWKLSTDGTLTISGNGHMNSYAPGTVSGYYATYGEGLDHPWYKYRAKIKKIVISSGVLSVGAYAFFDCYNCTSLEIQNGVTTIKDGAFAFLPINSLSLPDSVSSLGKYAFNKCSALKQVSLSDNITVLDEEVFELCRNLDSIDLPDKLTKINFSAFSNCIFDEITIPATVTFIDANFASIDKVYFLGAPPSFGNYGNDEPPFQFLKADYLYCLPEYYEAYKSIFEKWRAEGTLTDGLISAKLNKNYITLTDSEPVYQLTVSEETGNYTSFTETWWLEKPEIASVNQNGVVTASGHGKTMLYVEISADGHRSMASCQVSTKRNDLMVSLLPTNIEADFPVTCSTTSIPYGEVDYTSFHPHKLAETAPSNVYYQELLALTNDLTAGCTNDKQKAKAIWQWVSKNVTYGGAIGIGTYADQAYAVYVNRKAHCEGFAKLTGFMLYLADIPSCLVASSGHMWNIALTDGEWTMIDSTNALFGMDYNNCGAIEWIGFGTKDLCYVIDNTEGVKLAGTGDHPLREYKQDYTSLIVPDFVDIIFGSAFEYCYNLESVTLPASIKEISRDAFEDCENLTNVYFAGSEEQWRAITVKQGNNPLLNANIYFNGETAPHEHSYTSSVTTPATCAENGIITFACSCGNSYTESIPATGHTPGAWEIVTASTCTTVGKKVQKCTGCGEIVDEDIIPTSEHTAGEWQYAMYPTCSQEGYEILKCTVCNAQIDYRTVDTLPHTPGEWVVVEEARCGVDGRKAINCTVCHIEIESEIIDAPEHVESDWIVLREPTCSKEGIRQKRCTVCLEYISDRYEKIEKLPHSPASYWTNVSNATCTQDGLKIKKCTVCGGTAEELIIEATGHVSGEWKTIISPTCNGAGVKIKTCNVCGQESQRIEINPTGHTPASEWTVRKLATCTEDGEMYKKCIACDMDAETQIIDALGHNLDSEWIIEQNATCTENGIKTQNCTRCDHSVSETIPATGHTETGWLITATADCLNPGTKIKKCTVCGIQTDSVSIPATGHTVGEWEILETSTCSREGTKVKRCSDCGTVTKSESIPRSGHEKGNWVITETPTGGSYGVKARFCIGCGMKMEEKIIYSVSNIVVKDDATGVEVVYPDGTFTGTMTLSARNLAGSEIGSKVYSKLGECNFKGYEVKFFENGVQVNPSNTYSVKIPVPYSFNRNSAEVYGISMTTGELYKVAASYENGYFLIENADTIQYVITEKIITVSLSQTHLDMKKGDTVQLYAYTNGQNVTFTSSNPSVATVDIYGNVTAVGNGSAVITATVDGTTVKEECTVEVTQSFFDMIISAITEAFSGFLKFFTDIFKSINGSLS